MAILFVQRTATETKVIDCLQGENVGINDYWANMQSWIHEKKYIYGKHFAPHDANAREKSTGQTIIDTAKELGLVFSQTPQIGLEAGIQKLRLMFPRLYVNERNCEQPINALLNYHREWDEKLLKFKDDPVHDWSSHFADAFRYLAVVEKELTNVDEPTYTPDPNTRYQRPGVAPR